MRLLLVDNSNTRTKFALAEEGKLIGPVERFPTRELTMESTAEILARRTFDAAVLCSVVPDVAIVLAKALAGAPLHMVSHHSRLPIEIDYPAPAEIGADRLADAVAGHHLAGAPVVVVDFGTAVTFDVVGKPARYLGGAITPGLASMTEGLHRRTALLPAVDLAEPRSAIGRSTVEAMRAGAVLGYRGVIREILAAIRRELPGPPRVLATGGDAPLIARSLPEVDDIVPDLTLLGIRLIGEQNLR